MPVGQISSFWHLTVRLNQKRQQCFDAIYASQIMPMSCPRTRTYISIFCSVDGETGEAAYE